MPKLPTRDELPHYAHRTQREHLAACIMDTVGRFTYYDRKEDEELPFGEIERLIKLGHVTVADIVELFRIELERSLP
jgi:hypothetical protein